MTLDGTNPNASIELFERAVATQGRRLIAIARAIVGYRADPEDVVQQAVMNLYKHRLRYDWNEPGGLMKRAVINESLRILRQKRATAMPEEVAGSTKRPDEGMVESERVRKVREAIAQLPEHFRSALVLCEYEKLSYAEIAQQLDASIPQVKTWIHRARRKLATLLQDYMVTPDEK